MDRPFQNLWGNPKIGKGTKIGAFVDIGKDVEIGEDCVIQAFVSIPPGWKIGNRVFIGPGVHFANDKYPKASNEWNKLEGKIEDDVSIGMGALIGAGVTIGKEAVIGQGTNVLKDVPVGETWVGNPAQRINRSFP